MTMAAVAAAGAFALPVASTGLGAPAPELRWSLIAARPHDPQAFTQGLVAYKGVLLESTGLTGKSSIRRVDAKTGAVLMARPNAPEIFGEGLTVLRGTAWQLTWTNRRILGVDPLTLGKRRDRPYPREGWGLTTDGTGLIAGDGTATLRWIDPVTLRTQRRVRVTDDGLPVTYLNELELLDGVLWANIWRSDRVALIDPASGHVRAWLDLARLRARLPHPGEVLNGIARDPVTGHVVVTGKYWARMFVIRLRDALPTT